MRSPDHFKSGRKGRSPHRDHGGIFASFFCIKNVNERFRNAWASMRGTQVVQALKSLNPTLKCHAGQGASNGHAGRPERGFRVLKNGQDVERQPCKGRFQTARRQRRVRGQAFHRWAHHRGLCFHTLSMVAEEHHNIARGERGLTV